MPYAIDVSSAKEEAEEARDLHRMAERVKRDHATMRALLDDVERACRAVEEHRPESLKRLRAAVWTLHLAFDEHLANEEACFAPILRNADAWGELRVVNMRAEHAEQRRVILELIASADNDAREADGLVALARALIGSFRTDMDSEDPSLDDEPVVSDQEDG